MGEQLAALGASPEDVARIRAEADEAEGDEAPTFEVLPEAWPGLRLFLLADDCWSRAGMDATPIAWDVTAAGTIWRLAGEAVTPEAVADARVMARAACAALIDQAGRRRQKAEAEARRPGRGSVPQVRRR